jgi:hypothetical protein
MHAIKMEKAIIFSSTALAITSSFMFHVSLLVLFP